MALKKGRSEWKKNAFTKSAALRSIIPLIKWRWTPEKKHTNNETEIWHQIPRIIFFYAPMEKKWYKMKRSRDNGKMTSILNSDFIIKSFSLAFSH